MKALLIGLTLSVFIYWTWRNDAAAPQHENAPQNQMTASDEGVVCSDGSGRRLHRVIVAHKLVTLTDEGVTIDLRGDRGRYWINTVIESPSNIQCEVSNADYPADRQAFMSSDGSTVEIKGWDADRLLYRTNDHRHHAPVVMEYWIYYLV
jgi:hypothetical protein